jgi:hypothetical protein
MDGEIRRGGACGGVRIRREFTGSFRRQAASPAAGITIPCGGWLAFCEGMRMPIRALLLIALLSSGLFAEETYPIRLSRPVKAGDRFDVSAKMAIDDSLVTVLDGREVEDDHTLAACRLTGRLTVVAVTSKGQPMDMRLKLETVECVNDGQQSAFFKAGDELRLRQSEDGKEAEVNGKPADDLQSEAIQSILHVEEEGERTDDDVFGTSDKVKAGDEWPLNADAAVADLEHEGITGLKREHIKGHTRAIGATTIGGRPALLVRMDSKIDGRGIGLDTLPESVKATRFHAELAGEMELPLDLASSDGRTKALSKLEVDASGKIDQDGVEARVEIKIRRRVATELTATAVK